MFLGGVMAFTMDFYPQMKRPVNRRFDAHIPTTYIILYYEPGMDPIPVEKPRLIFPYTAVCATLCELELHSVIVIICEKNIIDRR